MRTQSLQNLSQNFEMILMHLCVHQEVVNVDDDVGDVS